jgi:hypothetical protein
MAANSPQKRLSFARVLALPFLDFPWLLPVLLPEAVRSFFLPYRDCAPGLSPDI